jgi:RNA polymerase sigma-70 factor (ECF subfamily)
MSHRVAARPSLPKLPLLEDPALVAGVVAGQRDAADELWRRYGPRVRRLLQRTLGPGGDVEDLVQETFIRLFRCLHTLENRQALAAFVTSVTTHVARAELKKRRVRRWVMLAPGRAQPDTAVWPADPAVRQALARFYRILDRLGAEERTAFVLRHMEGLDLAGVADALGRSLATTKRRLTTAWQVVVEAVERDPSLREYLGGSS